MKHKRKVEEKAHFSSSSAMKALVSFKITFVYVCLLFGLVFGLVFKCKNDFLT